MATVMAMTTTDCPLSDLPTVLLTAVLEYADHGMLHSAELSCSVLQRAIRSAALWEASARRSVTICSGESHGSQDSLPVAIGWKMLACMSERPIDRTRRLLRDVAACSSIDRPVETPSNTLLPSRCWLALRTLSDRSIMRRVPRRSRDETYDEDGDDHDADMEHNMANVAQIQCGCEMGDACYWSSSPSTDKNSADFIEYTVHHKSLVSHLQIIPYRAFWHPESPTYAPLRVSVSFYYMSWASATQNTKVLAYESPPFEVTNEMQLQEFELPRQIWLPHGGIMRLHLLGRYQAETFDILPWIPAAERVSNYYICLSYVGALGCCSAPKSSLRPRRAASFG